MDKKLYRKPISLAGGEERFVCPQSLVLNTYLGCSNSCCYCYARFLLEMYKHWDKMLPADVEVVKKFFIDAFFKNKKGAVYELLRRRVPFRFSNLTDPFQEMEKKYKVTYEVLKILKQYQYPALINTKGIIWVEKEYLELLKDIPCVIQVTITTIDDVLSKKLEPGAPVSSERIQALEKGALAGIKTQVRYSPVFPLIGDQPEEAFKIYSSIRVNDIICEFYRSPINKKQQDYINNALGYDYLQYLIDNNYPLEKTPHWWKVKKPFIFDEYIRFKKLAEKYGLNFYVCCEEKPEINNWENCCGTTKYLGMESCSNWTIQMNGYKFSSTPITFEDYIKDTNCPYEKEYKEFWDKGKHQDDLYNLKFDKITKTYKIINKEGFFD